MNNRIRKEEILKVENEHVFKRQSSSVVTRERKDIIPMENVRDQEKSKRSVSKVSSPSRSSITRRYSSASTLDQIKSSVIAPVSGVIWRARSKSTSIITRNNAENQQSVLRGTLLAPIAAVKLRNNSKSSSHSRSCIKENGKTNSTLNRFITPLPAVKWRATFRSSMKRRASEPTIKCYNRQLTRSSDSRESVQKDSLFVPLTIGKLRSKSKSPIRRQTASPKKPDVASLSVLGRRNSYAGVFSTAEISMTSLATIKRKEKSKQLHIRKNGLIEQSEKIPEIPETVSEDIDSVLNNGFSSDFENTLKSLRTEIKFRH
ncbi:unnamed protein product [Mytilus coruscus]|uniref:Uncharacterized protein n=1 Tax=Mytilus coruscus TaxID=42192 RepID=A0A6J7ZXY9_MYTCO|nr:unnamed protein product [Mytilus coruscus]